MKVPHYIHVLLKDPILLFKDHNGCLQGILWAKSRTNLNGIVTSFVRFEAEAMFFPIKT